MRHNVRDLATGTRCKAKTKHNTPCPHKAYIDGFCTVHFCIHRRINPLSQNPVKKVARWVD